MPVVPGSVFIDVPDLIFTSAGNFFNTFCTPICSFRCLRSINLCSAVDDTWFELSNSMYGGFDCLQETWILQADCSRHISWSNLAKLGLFLFFLRRFLKFYSCSVGRCLRIQVFVRRPFPVRVAIFTSAFRRPSARLVALFNVQRLSGLFFSFDGFLVRPPQPPHSQS